MMKFPYGISNFATLRTEGFLYFDRTAMIALLEQAGKQLLFLRPRRFGKSLLVSTLSNYYDLQQTQQFAALFGDLAIGKSPTSEHNQYMVMQWDFSQVSPQGNTEQIKSHLFDHINQTAKAFARRYAPYLKNEIDIYSDNAIATVESLLNAVDNSSHQLYLLIDEYDNFANEVLMHNRGDKQRYHALLEGEGILKTLFKVIKAGASQGKIARVFITGVSPVVMSDMTSGYNVAKNISLDPRFNALCGILQSELQTITTQVLTQCCATDTLPTVMETLRQFYNGYRFCYSNHQAQVYNPILCFHFLEHYQLECAAPRVMLDGNLAMDAGRIRYIANLEGGQAVIDWIMDEENNVTLDNLADDFSVENIWHLKQDKRYMLSLMYYFGILTLQGISQLSGKPQLGIPNLVVRGLYLEQLKQQALPNPQDESKVGDLVDQFYQTANLQPLIDFVEQKYFMIFSNRDYRWSNELTIKTAFASLLFNDLYYVMDSETELERRYTDLVMTVRPNMRQYQGLQDFVFEFKYLSLGDLGLSGEQLKNTAYEQLEKLAPVQAAIHNALTQLTNYRQVLVEKYQEPQRLHCLAVIALGFERIIWRK